MFDFNQIALNEAEKYRVYNDEIYIRKFIDNETEINIGLRGILCNNTPRDTMEKITKTRSC